MIIRPVRLKNVQDFLDFFIPEAYNILADLPDDIFFWHFAECIVVIESLSPSDMQALVLVPKSTPFLYEVSVLVIEYFEFTFCHN